ncbi:MAG TPA: hypothetical protein VLM38_24490 [Blastocatellia bacterium]|nr:hypothetical protein [Blastocatellia bacterium]
MRRIMPVVAVLLLMVGCEHKPAPVARAAKDPKIAAIEDRIAKTTPEGKAIIEKVQAMKPAVNGQLSTKTLAEMVDEYSKTKGAYNITPIGWEAGQKKLLATEKKGRWKVAFGYQDWQKQVLVAEWEYNADTNELYPFEKDNAVGFWSDEGADKKGKK